MTAAAAAAATERASAAATPAPQSMQREGGERSYGSDEAVAVGDVVEVRLPGEADWSEVPFTILAVNGGKYIVKQGVVGLPDFMVPGDPPWTADAHCGNVPEVYLAFPDELRAGVKFKEALDGVALPDVAPLVVTNWKGDSFLADAEEVPRDCCDSCDDCVAYCCGGKDRGTSGGGGW